MVIICQGKQTGYKAIRGASGTKGSRLIFFLFFFWCTRSLIYAGFANNIWSLCQMVQHQISSCQTWTQTDWPPPLLHWRKKEGIWAFFLTTVHFLGLPHSKFLPIWSLLWHYLPYAQHSSLPVFYIFCFPGYSVGVNDVIREISGILTDLNAKYTEYWITWHRAQRQLTVTGHSGYLGEELDWALLWLAMTMKIKFCLEDEPQREGYFIHLLFHVGPNLEAHPHEGVD